MAAVRFPKPKVVLSREKKRIKRTKQKLRRLDSDAEKQGREKTDTLHSRINSSHFNYFYYVQRLHAYQTLAQ